MEILLIFMLVFVNALFVATEYAIVRTRTTELELLISKGSSNAKITKQILTELQSYISACQLGITIVNLLLGWIGEDVFFGLLSPLFDYFSLSSTFSKTLSVFIGLGFITYFTITVGELAPKAIAIRHYINISVFLSRPLRMFYKIFKPFIWLLNTSANLILKLIGIEKLTAEEAFHSEEEIRQIILEGRKTGVIDQTEHALIEKIFDFNDKTAKEIMVPRNMMTAIDIDENRERIIQIVIEDGYSRIPVYKDSIDNIIGIIYSKDLIGAAEHKDLILLNEIIRPVHFIPENKHIGEILKDFQKKRIHIGIVVNEHGGVEGLITLEDILEEIVGEIEDEYDIETEKIKRDKKGMFLVNPDISIEEFNKRFNTDIPEDNDEYQTLSGFLQTVTGHIPEIYERIDYKGLVFTIMKKTGNRLLQIKIQRS
ncbi:MAG: HlyC/CorC family transporter [Ignavibacteriales bacterium]|nr:HlyC/CorC family transporter [Ignavibacteria bacterium]MCC6885125.1 HlyC/CorC family transporter [Ignavibacteriales bacterium]